MPAVTPVVIPTPFAVSMIVVTAPPCELPIIIVARRGNDPRAENGQAAIRVPAHALHNDSAVGVANTPHEYPVALTIERVLKQSVVLTIPYRAGPTPFTYSPQKNHVSVCIHGTIKMTLAYPALSAERSRCGKRGNGERDSKQPHDDTLTFSYGMAARKGSFRSAKDRCGARRGHVVVPNPGQ